MRRMYSLPILGPAARKVELRYVTNLRMRVALLDPNLMPKSYSLAERLAMGQGTRDFARQKLTNQFLAFFVRSRV